MSLTQLNATELARSLRAREVSAREVVDAFLSRIESEDAHYKSFLTVDAEGARRDADAAQALLDNGKGGPLTGVPVALKDNISTNGLRTTCASKILDTYVPPFDAHVVERLHAAGCPVLGKTNLDEFAMGASCENSAYFPSRNPWDTDLVPGGSSGGSAAAVSAELAPLSLGSDTGGSIRQPASLCGIVGFKPTYGRVSRYGLVAFGSSLDQIGPMGRNVEDTALLAEAISGHDAMDSTSLPNAAISAAEVKQGTLKGKKFALPKELFADEIDAGVRECVELAIETLTREGAQFQEVSLPSIAYGVTTYYIIAPAEASSNLARFDGIRFGPRLEGEGHIGNVAETRGKLFGPEVKLRIMVGTYALSAGYYDAYYLRAQQVRALMAAEFEQSFQEFDAVLSPTSPVVAFPIGGLVDDPMQLKLIDFCTIPANMGGFPSISLPCGLSNDLPVGMLLTGPVMGDEKLLQTAYSVERGLGRDYRRPPIL
ncbi:MAG: Asp-tRNA(Asn)/Glu-tRNA(Gln) amidotransferase subunit GatA [Armatimonadetes bacterium]|nr:Asp-tRNA(Asn)/Glu-tRNA(Gln) amidotransferase subunit GatA [Armatimonadota bacterium]